MARVLQPRAGGFRDFYEVLGVEHDPTTEEIRRAYRSLALQFHPDRNGGSPDAEERFKELAEAFHTLSDVDRREAYDLWGPRAMRPEAGFNGPMPDLDSAVAVFVEQFSSFVNEELKDLWEAESTSAPQPVFFPLRVRVSLAS